MLLFRLLAPPAVSVRDKKEGKGNCFVVRFSLITSTAFRFSVSSVRDFHFPFCCTQDVGENVTHFVASLACFCFKFIFFLLFIIVFRLLLLFSPTFLALTDDFSSPFSLLSLRSLVSCFFEFECLIPSCFCWGLRTVLGCFAVLRCNKACVSVALCSFRPIRFTFF